MIRLPLFTFRIAVTLVVILVIAPVVALAQPNPSGENDQVEKQPPQKKRQKMQHPEIIQQRIERLKKKIAELSEINSDDPQIEKLEKKLERLHAILERLERDGMPGPEGQHRGPKMRDNQRGKGRRTQVPPEKIHEFIEAHPTLERIFSTRPDGEPANEQEKGQMISRHYPQLERMVRACEKKDGKQCELLIASAETQFEISQKVWLYNHETDGESAKLQIRNQLAELVRKQVELEFELREIEIQRLEERLKHQREQLLKDRGNIDERVAKKLKGALSGKSERKRKGRPGRKARDGRQAPPPPRPQSEDGEL